MSSLGLGIVLKNYVSEKLTIAFLLTKQITSKYWDTFGSKLIYFSKQIARAFLYCNLGCRLEKPKIK